MAVGNALLDMWKEMQDEIKNNEDEYEEETKPVVLQQNGYKTAKATCPSCGEPLIFEGGCNICKSCGWSKCD
jgi:ribonucleoside-diphosphate reductase alpha chain